MWVISLSAYQEDVVAMRIAINLKYTNTERSEGSEISISLWLAGMKCLEI